MNYTKEQEQEAREEYNKVISSLDSDMIYKFKGHWEDKQIPNKFNRVIIEKGDKYKFMKSYFENKKMIEDAHNLNIENLLEDGEYYP